MPETPNSPGGLTRKQAVGWRNAIFAIFAVCGLGGASLLARTPAIKDALEVSTAQMGVLLFGIAIGSILGLLFAAPTIERLGTRFVMRICMVLFPIGLIIAGCGVTFAESVPLTFAGLFVFGFSLSGCDVAMNLSGAVSERVMGRTLMPVFHAFFSVGTMAGAGVGALAEALKIPIATQCAVIGVVIVTVGLFALRFTHSEHVLTEDAGGGEEPKPNWRSRLAIWTDRRTLLIGAIALGMAFAEGSANDWLALTMVEGHDVSKPNGALIFGVFVTAMTVGRLAGAPLLDRFGRVPVLQVSAVAAIVGLSAVIFVDSTWIAIVGVVFWGLGASLGFPTAMSAAADDPRTAAARVSAVATIGYLAFLVGPPVLGFLGEHFGLRNALIVVLALIVMAGLASPAAREPKQPSAVSD